VLFFIFVTSYFLYSKKNSSQKILEDKFINNYYRDEDLSIPKELNYKAPSKESTLKIPILMYHYVENVKDKKDTIRIGLNTPPKIFEEQLTTILKNEYTPVTQTEIIDFLKNKSEMPNKPIAITFDDGYEDFYTVAFPILKKYQVKATIYIIVDFLDYPNYMTRGQLDEIANSDLVEIGSHTLNHIYLKTANKNLAEKEIDESKKLLESYIQREIKSFAYPYGAFNEDAKNIVEESGYQSAVSVIPGINQSLSNEYFLYRLRPGFRTDNELIKFLENSK
jgi:peptidoglycan/xylan/chitin deacetylase (PgdA/CDA1 family)